MAVLFRHKSFSDNELVYLNEIYYMNLQATKRHWSLGSLVKESMEKQITLPLAD